MLFFQPDLHTSNLQEYVAVTTRILFARYQYSIVLQHLLYVWKVEKVIPQLCQTHDIEI